MIPFTHLHVHSQYSILDGAASVSGLVTKAKEDGMTALALTDHGTMFGIKEFFDQCRKQGVKPILGCETYVAARGLACKKDKKDRSGNHLILLAKNETGYKSLLKLISVANTAGMYYKPRIDKELLVKYHEGLIVTSACLGGEVPQKIMAGDIEGAEEVIHWYKDLFGEDYYLELQMHKTDDPRLKANITENQELVNKEILALAEKTGVKVIAANDVHFINAEDANAHDLLICLNTGKDLDDPSRMRYTKQEWFKTTEEMNMLFKDTPQALENTQEIVDKIEEYELNSAPIMPDFPLPDGFDDEDEYLAHLTYDGSYKRYGDPLPSDVKERVDFELATIKGMGFPGYFLIVQDFIQAARDMGVIVGPGRGSAAGSAVAYCIGVTNVDPIKYDLLFERFLNPDRVSMPDIDIDFDDDGRQQVLDWVTAKYGQDKVAHICTFGTMAAKMAIRDVARVLKLPLPEADRLAKMVPEAPKMTLKKAYKENPELEKEKDSNNELVSRTIQFAETLEGSVRQTGVHACGVLIGKNSLDENIPIMPTKGEDLLCTQYDGRFVEDIGLLKMDFLGLKTLSIIKETLDNVKRSRDIEINMDEIPMEDAKTYELFSHGDTTAIFQFESPGMKKYLRQLKPNRFEDLVAMNALYRPGPMEYIPDFIDRKHGRAPIVYDHPIMEPYLKDTYGITVFQEQVMLQSRALGGFTRGQSDTLRKAMGKKKFKLMEELKVLFVEGCKNNEAFMKGCQESGKSVDELIEKIWKDWEAFASYAFNKSHSVCYAYVAYQTGYLKAQFPAEFMAAVLSRNLSDISKITTFMEECRRMDLPVLGPHVNESISKFTVNPDGAIRFGMAGIKGVGDGAVQEIIIERDKNGPFKDVFDFAERVNLRSVNKKNWEALAIAGAFDNMGVETRSQFFAKAPGEEGNFIEAMIRYGNKLQQDKSSQQQSLFGFFGDDAIEIKKPEIPQSEPWSQMEELNQEKSLIGIYLSSHPLDDFKMELEHACNTRMGEFDNLEDLLNRKEIVCGGMVVGIRHSKTKKGDPCGFLTVEDYSGTHEFAFFSKSYVDFSKFFVQDMIILIRGKVLPSKYRGTEFKISAISLFSEERDELFKKLVLDIPLDSLTEELVTEMSHLIKENSGKSQLCFNIFDLDKKVNVSLFSRNVRVDVTREMVEYFANNPHIEFKIN